MTLAPALMTGEDWTQLCAAFDTLMDVPPARRDAALRRMTLDPALQARLHAMLAAEDATGILDTDTPAGPTQPPPAMLAPGSLVCGFQIDHFLGRGGTGEVYLAHRDKADFHQLVALKMLRADAAASLLGAERGVLASLEHPGIARLIDGGVAPDGRSFMAMEYVDGQEINRWCAQENPDLPTRLHLMLALCDAVAYAHARLVVHRDIKPANILVDAQGRARLLDFGIATLLAADGAEDAPAMATPDYAAPEQLEGGEVTVATDVYALGAVLYELLAGRGPWAPRAGASMPTVLRRLLSDTPPAIGAAVSADLEAIVMKALRRAPAERYASVEAFADDLRRFSARRPVLARDAGAGHAARLYVRRNRWGVAAGAALMLAIVGGTAGVAWQARKAGIERDVARSEAERAEAVNQAMLLMFSDARAQAGGDALTARQIIDSTAERIVASQVPGKAGSLSIVAALADLYMIVENVAGAQSLLEATLARDSSRSDPAGAARLKIKLAEILAGQRAFLAARQLLRQADAVWAKDPARFRRERVEAVGTEAHMLRLEGKRDEAIALLLANMGKAELAYAEDSRDLATRYGNLAKHLVEANRLEEAHDVAARARSRLELAGLGKSPSAMALRDVEGGILARRGDYAAAVVVLRTAVEDRKALYGPSAGLAFAYLQYARVLLRTSQADEALAVADTATPLIAEYLGAGTQPALMIGLTRADALLALGRLSEADTAFAAVSPGLQREGPKSLIAAARLLTASQLAMAHGDRATAQQALNEAARNCAAIGPAAVMCVRDVAALQAKAGAT